MKINVNVIGFAIAIFGMALCFLIENYTAALWALQCALLWSTCYLNDLSRNRAKRGAE